MHDRPSAHGLLRSGCSCGAVLLFLIAPILVIMPLSFNAETYFSYPMPGLSLQWYEDFFTNDRWHAALCRNQHHRGIRDDDSRDHARHARGAWPVARQSSRRGVDHGVLISPMIVPVIISALGMYFFYTAIGLTGTLPGLILAHTALATPFVVITVTATLTGFDRTLMRAGASLRRAAAYGVLQGHLPLILPGVISGALFAFVTSFDEVVVVLFLAGPEQRTLPKQMFTGIREQISPTITAAATRADLFSTAHADHRRTAAPPVRTPARHQGLAIFAQVFRQGFDLGLAGGDRGQVIHLGDGVANSRVA